MVDFLDQECEIVVGGYYAFEVAEVRFAGVEAGELWDQGVGEGDADVVDCCLGWWGGRCGGVCGGVGGRAVDVGFVDADCVGELDRGEGVEVWEEEVGDVGEVDGLFAEELSYIKLVVAFLRVDGISKVVGERTFLSGSSHTIVLLSSSSCKPIARQYSQIPCTAPARSSSSVSKISASSGLSLKRSFFSSRTRLIVTFIFSSPLRSNSRASKFASAAVLLALEELLPGAGLRHSIAL